MTHILIKCKKCGAKEHTPVYGYVKNPIGVPFSRCPYCGAVYANDEAAEWIQMSPWTKYRSIHPRAGANAFFLGLVFLVAGILLWSALHLQILKAFPGFRLPPVVMVPFLVLPFLLAHYVLVVSRANSGKFIGLYCESILRTRNPDYRKTLEKNSVIYGEEIPRWIHLSKQTRTAIFDRLETEGFKADVEIPSLFDVRNSD